MLVLPAPAVFLLSLGWPMARFTGNPSLALKMMSFKAEQRSRGPIADLIKRQERLECGRISHQSKPFMVRLDGKAFHTFTRGLIRPYDQRLSQLMVGHYHPSDKGNPGKVGIYAVR